MHVCWLICRYNTSRILRPILKAEQSKPVTKYKYSTVQARSDYGPAICAFRGATISYHGRVGPLPNLVEFSRGTPSFENPIIHNVIVRTYFQRKNLLFSACIRQKEPSLSLYQKGLTGKIFSWKVRRGKGFDVQRR